MFCSHDVCVAHLRLTNFELAVHVGFKSVVPSSQPKQNNLLWSVLDWPRLSYREQFKEGDKGADRGNDGKTTSKSGLALNGTSYYGKSRTVRSGGSWL